MVHAISGTRTGKNIRGTRAGTIDSRRAKTFFEKNKGAETLFENIRGTKTFELKIIENS